MRAISVLLLLLFQLPGYPKTWTVDPKSSLSTIKAALEVAGSGDTILILQGVYKEGNIIIKKPIALRGVNYPMLDGENKYEIITLAAHDVSIEGLRFINTGRGSIEDIAAIKALEAKRLSVINCQFENTFFGVYLANSSACRIEGNILHAGSKSEYLIGNGIHAWKCDSLIIRNNQARGHRDGIYFEFVTHSLVENNWSEGNMRYGLHFMFSHNDEYRGNTFKNNGAGVAVMYTHGVTMTDNKFESNWGPSSYGLLLKEIRDSHIDQNLFSRNTIGIFMEGSSRCGLLKNKFEGNGWAVKIQANCDGNNFTKNNFVNNTFDMSTNGTLVLNALSGNYWDKYEGYDLNKDGVGDVPFHPVSLYSMVVEKMPSSVMLWRSFLVYLLDRTEKVVPSVTPESLKDNSPAIRPYDFNF